MTRPFVHSVALSWLVVATASCGGDAGGAGASSTGETSTEGARAAAPPDLFGTLFEITDYSINTSGCDAPGPSARQEDLGGDQLLYFWQYDAFGQSIAQTVTCGSASDCKEKAAAWAASQKMPQTKLHFMFSEVVDATHRNGTWAMTGFQSADGKLCEKAEAGTLKLEQVGDEVRIEVRLTVGDVPAGSGRMPCSTDVAKKTLGDRPCNLLKVLRARARGPL